MIRLLIVCCLMTSTSLSLLAQCPGCEIILPDDLGVDTIYLSAAPDGQVGLAYDEDLSFRLPLTTDPVNAVDPTTPAGLDISQFEILGVVGLPTGLLWEANQISFLTEEQTDGCVKLCGTPFLAGLYEVEVVLEAHIFFLTQQTSFTFFLQIDPAQTITEGFSIENNAACGSLTTNFVNNIASNGADGFSYFWDLGNGNSTTMETPNSQTYSTSGDYEISYQAIVDTAGFFLTQVVIEQTPCTDLFNAPDLKFDLFDPNGEHLYTVPIVSNASLPIIYDLLIPIGDGNYELHVIDDDGGLDGADDLCGVINFNHDLSGTISAGDLIVSLQMIHPVDTIQSTETIHVYPVPNAPLLELDGVVPFCEGDVLHLVTTNYVDFLSWSVDSLAIPMAITDTLEITESGEYTVFYTSENGCTSDASTEIISFAPLPEPFVLQQDGNLIRIEDESELPLNFSFNWYYENDIILSATDLLLCAEAAGNYSLQIIDNDTECSTSAIIDASYNAGLDCSTALDELTSSNDYLVYPNPFSSSLMVQNESGKELSFLLRDALGRLVLKKQLRGIDNPFETDFLNQGIYFYQINTNEGLVLQNGKLIKN